MNFGVVQMDLSLESVNAVFLVAFFLWILIRALNRGRNDETERAVMVRSVRLGFSFLTMMIILCNVLLAVLHLGFAVCEFWYSRVLEVNTVISSLTWFLASMVSLQSKNRYSVSERKRWPRVLLLWWIFCLVLDSILVTVYLITRLGGTKLPDYFPVATGVDLVRFPLLAILNAGVLASLWNRRRTDIECPLLGPEDESGLPKLSEGRNQFMSAGIWSRITFRWLNSLLQQGRLLKLKPHHVPSVPQSESADHASSLLENSLSKQKNGDPHLLNALGSAVWRSMAMNAVLAGTNTAASYVGPFLITSFVNFLAGKNGDSDHLDGMLLTLIFFLAKTVESLSQRHWYFGAQRIGIRIKAALTVLIYKKSLSMKFVGSSNGKIVNLINVDVERIGDFCWHIHGIWLLPFQVMLALAILYRNLGAAPAVAALISTVMVMVSNTPLAKKQEKYHSKIMDAKDSRIKATSETLKSIRVLKLHSWEPTFLKKILEMRETERNWLNRYLYMCSAICFLFWASPTLVSVITFGVCVLLKTPLTSGTVLSALATFRILQEPIYNLPELISMIGQTKVSITRIEEFIREEDHVKPDCSENVFKSPAVAVEMEVGEYSWDARNQNVKKPTIRISERMEIMRGQKVAICGSVGSGKSSLISSILGEIPRVSGAAVRVYGTKAYVPQSAWIQSGTVRDNVLFGRKCISSFYEEVLEGCALNQDIELWNDGDMSVIGERGMNISGGQKQRIQLARAVYSDSDVYILDDPFSAVDAHTGTHLFKKCLMKLLSSKTVIYTTHQLEFLSAADLVVVMKDGVIVQSGKYEDLIADSDGELVKQMTAHRKSLNQVNPKEEDGSLSSKTLQPSENIVKEEQEKTNSNSAEKLQEEETETGRVKWGVYSIFITAAYRGALVPVMLLCHVLFYGLQMASNYWLAWGTEEQQRVSNEKLLGIFILISGGSSLFILGRAVLLANITLETAQKLFLGMITSVFRAPVSFFDSTPSSRILNRSSTDQSTLDTDIPYRLAGLVFAVIQLFSIIVLMSQIAWHVFLLFLAILAISAWYQAYYITSARELARMVGTRKAPILHHFTESIAGAATVRCFNQEDRFLMKITNHIDDYSAITFHNSGAMEWLCVRINFLFNLVFWLVLVILVNLPSSAIDPTLAGLAATYGLSLNVLQAWVIWNLCNVENKMISVERVLQFSKIPSEAPMVIEHSRPKPEWPNEGKIEFQDLQVQYDPTLPVVLKGINCTFPGGKKIGVVGRTGSGKSTLIQALFRIVEPCRGRILIDDLDISSIGLQDLRSRLGIIPQDPMLFNGTVRSNLDPLQQHSDHELWEVLRKCHLGDTVKQDNKGLDSPVAEDGENWSVGQRQLVCLARVLLKKRKILILDEATASIDTATDNLIQETIREETRDCTVITIAHRIPTIIDNDLVLVLDEGNVMEFDSPKNLLEDNSLAFSKLVAEFLRRSSDNNQQSSQETSGEINNRI